jgi:hypothetical protein
MHLGRPADPSARHRRREQLGGAAVGADCRCRRGWAAARALAHSAAAPTAGGKAGEWLADRSAFDLRGSCRCAPGCRIGGRADRAASPGAASASASARARAPVRARARSTRGRRFAAIRFAAIRFAAIRFAAVRPCAGAPAGMRASLGGRLRPRAARRGRRLAVPTPLPQLRPRAARARRRRRDRASRRALVTRVPLATHLDSPGRVMHTPPYEGGSDAGWGCDPRTSGTAVLRIGEWQPRW